VSASQVEQLKTQLVKESDRRRAAAAAAEVAEARGAVERESAARLRVEQQQLRQQLSEMQVCSPAAPRGSSLCAAGKQHRVKYVCKLLFLWLWGCRASGQRGRS
jgi:hypothetical protein